MFVLKHLKLAEVEEGSAGTPAPVVEEEDTVSDEVQALWGELADSDDDLVDEEVSEVDEEAPEVVAPTAEVKEDPVVAQETQDPPATPAAEVEPPAPVVEAPVVETPEERQARIQELRTNAMTSLSKQFELSEDEATKMMTAPQEVMPKLLAKVFMNVYDAVTHGMTQNLPNIIRNVQQQEVAIQESKNTFYGAWPKLDPVQHGPTVARIAAVYGQMYPNATPEEIIRDVGAQAMFALKIPVEATAAVAEPPAAPAARTGFRPAGGTPAARTPAQGGTSDNVFVQLAEEFLDDE